MAEIDLYIHIYGTKDAINVEELSSADVVSIENYKSMERTVDKLNKALAERKRGKWNWIGFNIECSECGAMPNFDSTEPLYNFCPNCGAKMEFTEAEEKE